MKAIVISISFFLINCLALNAQSYYYFQTNGEQPSEYDLNKVNDTNNITKILIPKTNDQLSTIHSIPFPFRFKDQYYTDYKVSDNGFMTFNTDNTISYKPDSAFTNLQDLKNSIIPFWYDFQLKKLPYPNQEFNIRVYSYTQGTTPNRKHIIQFYGLTKAGDSLTASVTNGDVFSFAIILHEGSIGRFDFAFNFFGRANIKGFSGCMDEVGNSLFIKNKPIPFPVSISSDKSNTIVYQFYPGKQAFKNLYLKQNLLESKYKVKDSVIIKSKITNLGSDTVYQLIYQYTINQKDTFSDIVNLKSGLLPNGENTLTFVHTKPWSSGLAGSISHVKTYALVSADSLNIDSNTYSKNTKVLRIIGAMPIERNVLLEISTGGWCGYCPNAHYVGETLKTKFKSRLIPVMHHFGDPMETEESNKINTVYQKGYPYGVINRKFFTGQADGWQNIVNLELKDSTNVSIKILNKAFDPATRKITFTLHIKFHDYLKGNYRVGAIITENNVRGDESPSQWSQNNYYSKFYNSGTAGGPDHPYYNELHYMDGYLHQAVVLDFPMGAWGKDSSLPGLINPEDEFNYNISYTLPATETVDYNTDNNTRYCSTRDDAGYNLGMYKPIDINLIGFVAEYQENIYNRTILNVGASGIYFNDVAVQSIKESLKFKIYPNPSANNITISIPFNQSANKKVEITSLIGNVILTAAANEGRTAGIVMDISNLPAGIYFVRVSGEENSSVQKLNVVR